MRPTPRQLEILRLYASGLTRSRIGAELFMATVTVAKQLQLACKTLGAENSTHAVTICFARGYLCVYLRGQRAEVYVPEPIEDLIESPAA